MLECWVEITLLHSIKLEVLNFSYGFFNLFDLFLWLSDLTTWSHTVFFFRNATDDFQVNILAVCVLFSSRGKVSFDLFGKDFREWC